MLNIKTISLSAALLLGTSWGALAEVSLALSTSQNATDPLAIAMEEAAVKIAERSKGEIKVTVYPSSQLGADNDVLEQARNGAPIAVLVDAGRLAPFKSELGILSAPYLVDDWTQYEAITASPPYQKWVDEMAAESGLRVLNYNWFQGARHMFTQKPVSQPADLNGVRVRTIDAPGWLATVNAMGATAVPMPWSEVYSALQLGAIDGAEAQLTGAAGIKLHEVTKHLAFTNHVQLVTGLVTSEKWFQSLSEEQRQIISEELQAAGKSASLATVAKGEGVLAEMKAAGLTVSEIDTTPFVEATKGVYAELGLEAVRAELQPYIDAAK